MKAKSYKFLVIVPQNLVSEPIIHKLSADFKVVPNIIRGRITTTTAKLEVELSGSKQSIAKANKYLVSKGIKVKKL